MNCATSRKFIDAYMDGELEPGMMLEMEGHMAACADCSALHLLKRRMQRALREGCAMEAPAALRQSVRAIAASGGRRRWTMVALPAAAAAAVLVGVLFVGSLAPSDTVDAVVEDMVARHARALPMEIADAREDAAASWFQGNIDCPVRPLSPGLKNASFEGARVSNVRDQQAAQMTYLVDGRRVTFLVFPAADLTIRGGDVRTVNGREYLTGRRNGYNVALTREGDMIYAVSSDLSANRLVSLLARGR